ncbi:GntR family transcriptional regulator [Lysinibacter sp. HNR]|uniref:GntR family transcriptional regulator n=1 Tax=Lysinibacter sp. HNR TaxID=3031408 RepID=UPI0024354271|nr:GntR family transcriptional regulator [Lysinibacter sp. HNR]WGD38517.1 GntR family transcriptional regulator [Lysinibacter sp. HNR]
MRISISSASTSPPFEQIRTQIIALISSGALAAETRLPTVRKLADDLGVAPNTVARAYRDLEARGIIETRGRNGTFVSPYGDPVQQEAQRAAAAFSDEIRRLGITPENALTLVRAALETPLHSA